MTMYCDPEAEELHVSAFTVGAPVLSQPLPLALLVTPLMVTVADPHAWACAALVAALFTSLRTEREIVVGFVTVVSGEVAVTVGGLLCVAYVDVVTDTPQDVSTIASKPASAAVHNRIAANPPLNAVDIGCLLTEARSHLSSLAQNLATLLALVK